MKHYTVQDVVDRFGVTEQTVLHWRSSGQLRAINVGRDPGKQKARWRFSQEEIERFETARATVPPAEPTRRRKRAAVTEFYK